MPRLRTYLVHAVLLLMLLPRLASAQPQLDSADANASYQRLVDDGLAAYASKQFTAARAHFAKAHAMLASARTFRALGRSDFALDNYTLARAELEAALAHPTSPLTPEQRSEVDQILAWMRANLSAVHLELAPAAAHAEIDGKPVQPGELLLEPGEHRLEATASGYEPYNVQFKLELGAPGPPLNVTLVKAKIPALTSPTAEPHVSSVRDSSHTWMWLGGGGALVLASGATLFGLGLHENALVEAPGPPQPLREIEQQQSRGMWLTGLGIGFGALGVAGIAGSILLFTQRHADPNPSRAWHVSVGVAQVRLHSAF